MPEQTEQIVATPQPAQPDAARPAIEAVPRAGIGQSEQKAQPAPAARLSEAVTVLTHGWKAYSKEQISKGRWTAEQVAHPEQKLLPEMNSKEIKQGISGN